MKRNILLMLAVVIFLASLPLLSAGDGKELFISKCGSCHKTGGEAAPFAPKKYAKAQWERFFARDQHKRKKDISGMVKPEEVDAIKVYLSKFAADSPTPEAAGLK